MADGTQPTVTVVTGGDRKVRLGVQMMDRYQRAIEAEVRPVLQEIESNIDTEKITRLAWKTLGKENLYIELKELEKRQKQIEEELALFNGGRCSYGNYSSNYRYDRYDNDSPFSDASIAAKDMLYPEIDKLKKILTGLEARVTFCLTVDDLEALRDKVAEEVKMILKEV